MVRLSATVLDDAGLEIREVPRMLAITVADLILLGSFS